MIRPRRNEIIGKSGLDSYISELKNYINEVKNDKISKHNLLEILLKSGRYSEFEEYFEIFLKSHGDESSFYRLYGRYLLFEKFEHKKAESVLQKAIELNKHEPAWVYYFANIPYTYYEKVYDGVLYTAIPKNASTSLKSFILEKVYNRENENPHGVFGNPYFKTTHFTEEEIKNSLKVLVTRDPVARFYSYYNKNIIEEDSLAFEYRLTGEKKLFNLDLRPKIQSFIKDFWRYCLVFDDVLHHTLPQMAYIESLENYNFICDISEVDQLVSEVSKKLKIDTGKNIKVPRKMTPKNKIVKIDDSKIDMFIATIYTHDYCEFSKNKTAKKSINLKTQTLEELLRTSFSPKTKGPF